LPARDNGWPNASRFAFVSGTGWLATTFPVVAEVLAAVPVAAGPVSAGGGAVPVSAVGGALVSAAGGGAGLSAGGGADGVAVVESGEVPGIDWASEAGAA
jgi:hypothetical protein